MMSEFARPDRRQVLAASALAGTASMLLADGAGAAPASTRARADAVIRPFRFRAADAALADLRRRVLATKWPSRELVPDPSQGVQLATMQNVARYWATEYDWRRGEAKMNAFPHFMTDIDGVGVHFIHVRSNHEEALPIILTHGWPGSFLEMLKIVGPLTDPTAHGGTAADAFHVVIPSMPGYGFSEAPTETGWDPVRIARAWAVLMQRLGYTRYVAQGGDWGDPITELLAVHRAPGLLGVHSNMPAAVPRDVLKVAATGGPAPAGLSAEEKHAYDQLAFFFTKGLSYAQQMASRPQTLYAIEDSPVGLAAWLLDHDRRSYEMIARAFGGGTEGLTRDDVLDNVTLYWLTNTAVSSSRLYWESKLDFFAPLSVDLPVAVSAFPDELYTTPRSWAERAFPNLIHYNRLEKGGHFAAWEQPAIFSQELRTAFRPLRRA